MGPNDVDLARVFVREPGTTVGDDSIAVTNGLQIVVESEAGSAIHGQGTQFLTNIVVRDLTANTNIVATPVAGPPGGGYAGSMATAAWPAVDHQFVWNVPASTVPGSPLAGRNDHLCEVLAFIKAGIVNPDVEFATSYTFILT